MKNSAFHAEASKEADPGAGGYEKGSFRLAWWYSRHRGLLGERGLTVSGLFLDQSQQSEETGLVLKFRHSFIKQALTALVSGHVLCSQQGKGQPEVNQTVPGWLKVS